MANKLDAVFCVLFVSKC